VLLGESDEMQVIWALGPPAMEGYCQLRLANLVTRVER